MALTFATLPTGRTSRKESPHFQSGVVESDLPEKTQRTTWFGLRRAAVFESLVMLAVLMLFDVLFLDGTRYWSMSLHPFFAIVILISAQYGSSEGIFAAILCTVALLLGNLPEQSLDQDWYDYMFELTYRPVLWLTLGLLLGELRERHIRERDRLSELYEDASERESVITESYRSLQKFKESLETRIASQMRSGLTVYRAGMALETLNPDEVITNVGDIVHSLTNARKFSVFLLKGKKLEAVVTKNWEEGDSFQRSLKDASPLYQEVIGRRRLVCIVNENDRALLGNEGLMAGPIRNRETGEVIGMLKIEEASFLDLNMSSIETFRMLCDWVGATYGNARRYEQAKATSMVNPDHQLLSRAFLDEHTQFITSLAKRAGFDVSMLLLRLDNKDKLGKDDSRTAAIALGKSVQGSLRTIDQAFDYEGEGWDFAILLPYTPAENAHVVVSKIRKGLETSLPAGLKPKPVFSHEIRALHTHQAEQPVKGGK